MSALVGALIGLGGSALPAILGFFTAKRDQAHELAILTLQNAREASGHSFRMDEIGAESDIREVEALHNEFAKRQVTWKWIEALISSVRPVMTYAFFLLYAGVKVAQIVLALNALGGDAAHAVIAVWHEEDQAIFATIVAFWFGGRAMSKFRKGQ